jgi:pimeloyl-ACP methyl ester carboxylesterase
MKRLILIHGFGCDSRFWKPQQLAIEGFDLCIPDLPYHGGPEEGVEKSLQGMADWVVRTHLHTPAVLIGHSLGGMISLQIVRDHPNLVRGIILMDSFPSLELNNRFLPGLYYHPMDYNVLEWIESHRKEIISRMSQETYDDIWPSVYNFDARQWLPEIKCPVLGIYGGRGLYANDTAGQLKIDLNLDKIKGNSTVEVVPNAGHFVNLEFPGIVNNMMADWLKNL